MSTIKHHPCAGHSCDHCFCCDVLGICCATIPAELRVQLEAAAQTVEAERFRRDVVAEAGQLATLADLICAEAEPGDPALSPGPYRLALPPAPAADATPANNFKEASYVFAARKA